MLVTIEKSKRTNTYILEVIEVGMSPIRKQFGTMEDAVDFLNDFAGMDETDNNLDSSHEVKMHMGITFD